MAKSKRRKYKDKLSRWEDLLLRFNLASEWLKLQEGRIVYRELEKGLPRAMGEREADRERIARFIKAAEPYPAYKIECCREWLRHELSILNSSFMKGMQSAREEEADRRWTRIYTAHLEALEK